MLNQISLVGRVTGSPKERSVGDNKVANVKMAVDRDYTDRNGDTPTDFIWVQVWNQTAGFTMGDNGRGVKQGDIIGVNGSLRIDEVDDGNGGYDRYTKVNANTLKLITQYNGSGNGGNSNSGNSNNNQQSQGNQNVNQQPNQPDSLDDVDMDPPF